MVDDEHEPGAREASDAEALFDDLFVAGARFHEPPADERARAWPPRGTGGDGPDGTLEDEPPAGGGWRRRRRRRLAIRILLLSLLTLVALAGAYALGRWGPH